MYFCKTLRMGVGERCKTVKMGGWSPIRSKVCVRAMVGKEMDCLRMASGQFFPWQKLPSGGRWYALKCVTPGVSAWSHRSSINISIKIKHVQQYISSSCIIYHHDHHISRLNISYHIIKHIIKHKTYIIMVIIYHVSYIIMIIIYHHHWSCIMYLGYVSSEIVILVVIEITVNKVITASIIKVVTKDRCVFKKWVVLGSHRAVSRIELLRS